MDIVIYVTGQGFGVVSGYRISGQALIDGVQDVIQWTSEDIAWDATPAQANQAIVDAAVAEALAQSHVIGSGVKTVIGGA